ncbi:MAG: hypothetical protein EBY22_09345 [Gammaproteobacteria bacterium]|nr:hypothetical protein [Gammaproteobacteria bacterium]
MIEAIAEQVKLVTAELNTLIEQDSALNAKKEVLKTIPGIGDITLLTNCLFYRTYAKLRSLRWI